MKRTLSLCLVATLAAGASAQQVFTRGALNALLVSSTTDDFEAFSIGSGNATNLDVVTLDSTTIANGQGPGLVNPGVRYEDPSNLQLQWNGDLYYGLNTKTLLANGSLGKINIAYTGFVQAMGVDIKVFDGFGFSGTMDVFDTAGALVGSVGMTLAGNAGESVFVGWQHNAGIGSVSISSGNYSWSPLIDDHTWGTVPEPGTMIALGAGLAALAARRRRR